MNNISLQQLIEYQQTRQAECCRCRYRSAADSAAAAAAAAAAVWSERVYESNRIKTGHLFCFAFGCTAADQALCPINLLLL